MPTSTSFMRNPRHELRQVRDSATSPCTFSVTFNPLKLSGPPRAIQHAQTSFLNFGPNQGQKCGKRIAVNDAARKDTDAPHGYEQR